MKKYDEVKYIITRCEKGGCYNCAPAYDAPSVTKIDEVYDILGICNLINSIFDGKEKFDYPLKLYKIEEDGEIEFVSDFNIGASCVSGLQLNSKAVYNNGLSGLQFISFEIDGVVHKVEKMPKCDFCKVPCGNEWCSAKKDKD